jgi:2-polyprenyl-3-methyl-5-hydroxy-6-metoxy-1,4-benzoquinol methylase
MVGSSYYRQARSEMFEFIPKGLSIALEVGCGSGFFGKELIEQGMEVWGIEKSKEAGTEANNRLSGVFIGTLEEFFISKAKKDSTEHPDNSIFEKTFDCIIFNDVLEHMSDPWVCLDLSKSLLKNEGIIVASIPNIRFYRVIRDLLIGKDFRYVEKGVMDRSHLRFFT